MIRENTSKHYSRPFLKWPGGKYRLRHTIADMLPASDMLIEPFVGSGAIFLNTDYPKYLLCDTNPDLINLYQVLQQHGSDYIADVKQYFTKKYNNETSYYHFRDTFNQSSDLYLKAILLLYLNRHGYNGLVRYNNSGEYNVPFGRYDKPYFPYDQLHYFAEHSQKARFVCQDFRTTMSQAKTKSVLYCDPPYVPLSHSANFTNYSKGGFEWSDHEDLAQLAMKLAKRGIHVLVSNHATPLTKKLYQQAKKKYLTVSRVISQSTHSRQPVKEILALFPSAIETP